ncbi:60S ribosomal subunit assembly or modification protein [Dispira parvispora]|uniref:60S ribosomal subunit assembly or modification protein n=1 Tax=Dispira parvispora TaxID=1520584 RepID=A0A9W8E2I8_9FUNG|nr:60S ribosomal subunit assembly or modification protein [Dispira parvispora]
MTEPHNSQGSDNDVELEHESENVLTFDDTDDQDMVELQDDSVQGFFAHGEPVYSVAMHPNNDVLVASGGGDDKAYLWRRDTGETCYTWDGFTDSVTTVRFNLDGTMVAAGSMDGKVGVWYTADGKSVATLDGPSEVTWLDWHSRGNILLAGSADGTMWMWALPSGQCMNVFSGHPEPVTCGQFTPNGRQIVTGSDDGSLNIWDPKTATTIHRLNSHDARFHAETITAMDVSSDSTIVLTGSTDHTARLVHLQNGQMVGALGEHTDSVETVGFSHTMSLAATGSVDGKINIWDVQTLRLRQTVHHDEAVTKLLWHHESPLLTTTSADRTVKVWDARTGHCEKTWVGHHDAILDFAMTKDGHSVVTGSDDGCCLVFTV